MRTLPNPRLRRLVFLLLALAGTGLAQLPRIRILATGGTIAATQSKAAGGYTSGTVGVEELLRSVPQIREVAEISAEQISNIGSQTMTNDVWLKLANRLNQVLRDGNIDGAVITHGTDTMEETAYFLSLVTKSDKPVVMVGAMHPADSIASDGPINLYNAIALAANPRAGGRGVLVLLSDEIHFAREVEKSSTTQWNAFESRERARAGLVQTGEVNFLRPLSYKLGSTSEFSIDGMARLPRVDIVYSYANLGRDTIDYLVARGVKGIVLAGVGGGNTTDEALAALSDAVKQGVAVVRSTRINGGLTRRNIEINDDQMGFVASGDLSPQKARILLMLALTKTKDPKKLQDYFLAY